jgi:hypothetical protein
VVLGVLLDFANGLAYVGIAVLLFPILRQRLESLALAYVGFRVAEFILQILADVSPLALLTLTEDPGNVGAAAASGLQALGALLLAERFWAFQMLKLIFSASALLLYYMLRRAKLIPDFLHLGIDRRGPGTAQHHAQLVQPESGRSTWHDYRAANALERVVPGRLADRPGVQSIGHCSPTFHAAEIGGLR